MKRAANGDGQPSARFQNPCHFAQALRRIGEEHQAELAYRCIESRIRKRKLFGTPVAPLDARALAARDTKHVGIGVQAGDRALGSDTLKRCQGQHAGSAGDVDHTLARLERVVGYQAAALKAKDPAEFYALDVRFHTMLFERLAMRRVAEVVDTSRAQLERARRLMLPTGRSQHTLKEHRAILAALGERSPAQAGRAMGAHLDAVMEELKKFAARQPELFEL